MANIRLCLDVSVSGTGNQWADPANTITASSAASALPATATQNPDRRYIWRSLSQIDGQWLLLTAALPIAATCCAVANLKLQNNGSVKLQSCNDGVTWVDVGTFPAADPVRNLTFLCFAAQTNAFWRLLFVNGSGAVADYAEVGYAFLGQYFEPTINFDAPMDIQPVDLSVPGVSDSGQKTFTRKSRYDAFACQFSGAPQADADSLQAIYELAQTTVPFFLLVDTSKSALNYLARFSAAPMRRLGDLPSTFDWSAAFEEAL